MNTAAHGNGDALSQSPLPVVPVNVQDSFVTVGQFCSWTQKDPIPSKVVQFLQQSCPSHGEPSITPFLSKKTTVYEKSYFGGIMCGGS